MDKLVFEVTGNASREARYSMKRWSLPWSSSRSLGKPSVLMLVDITVEVFVGVEFGGVGGQVEDLDLVFLSANHSSTARASCTLRLSTMRKIFLLAEVINWVRKVMNTAAVILPV